MIGLSRWYVGIDEMSCYVTGRSPDGRSPDSGMRWMTIRNGERAGIYPSFMGPPMRPIGAVFSILRPAQLEDSDD